jgi:hypothetical protein
MNVIQIDPSKFRPANPQSASSADAAERNRVMKAHAEAMADMRRFRILKLVKFH